MTPSPGRWLLLLALSALLAACSSSVLPDAGKPSEDLVVFAAASLTEAFQELAGQFEAENPGVDVVFNFAGSQQLAQQLGQGAAADVFATANNGQMQAAIQTGRVVSGAQQIFAGNRLVVVTPADNPAGLTSLQDLAQPGVKIVLAAREVPVGGYSLDFLQKAGASSQFASGYAAAVLANVVSYEQNVKAVLSKVALGEADAGIVYSSDIAPNVSDDLLRVPIPDQLNSLAPYPIAPVADAASPEAARRFVEFVLSPEGQAVLTSHDFVPREEIE